MQRLLIVTFFVLFFAGANAQHYGNEWIDYSLTYYKIPITEEGIYRITYQALMDGGFPVNSYQPRNIQMFIKGKEWPIYIAGEADGIFHPYDYIEFYAPPPDGWLDSLMFTPSGSISNPYYSMYNDTLYAFITTNYSINNLRADYQDDVNFAAFNSNLSSWCIFKKIFNNPQYYYAGSSDPIFSTGEGWFDTDFLLGGSITHQISTPGYAGTVYPVSVEYSVAGASNPTAPSGKNHHLRISLDNTIIEDTLFTGYVTIKNKLVPGSALQSTSTIKAESVNDLSVSADRMTIAYLTIEYPRLFNFSNTSRLKFTLPPEGVTKTLLSISGISSTEVVMWDISNNRKILCQQEQGNFKALVPETGANRECYFSTAAGIKTAVLNGRFHPVNYKSVCSGSDYLIITHSSLINAATQYKNYRDNSGYHASVVDIDQLYCQFSYGVNKHPLSIRNFIDYALDSFPVKPQYLLLAGKSVHAGRWAYDECFRKDSLNYSKCLVPSWGSPSSDNMLVAGLNGVNFEMPLAVGRVSAVNSTDLTNYLEKVEELEALTPAMWMKNIIHFAGGQNTWEQTLFAGYLANYQSIISDTLFGGRVHTFYKTTSNPVQITTSDSIRGLINGGVTIMNFFGHGSSTGFDQNIQDPSYYENNNGKYPLLIANSCLTGDIHLPPPLRLSESWVLTPQGGSIAFLASVDLGYSDRLNVFTTEFIRNFSYSEYNKTLGKQVQYAVNNIVNNGSYSQEVLNTAMDFTLHGDPAVVLNSFPAPDLFVDNSSVYFSPSPVTTAEDTFSVSVIVYNQGMAITDTFFVELTRTFPDGQTENYYKTMYGCINRDTVTFRLPVNVINGSGPNRFCVRADSENWIAEYSENNNSTCTDIIIQSGDLIPVYPYEYAIYPDSVVTLKASSAYAFANPQQCVFQLDTNDIFLNPIAQTQFTYPGGVAEWQPPVALQDCTVYYWRVSLVPQGTGSLNWKESSFIYIPGKTGWSQAHFFQFKKDSYRFIDYDRTNRDWDYVTSPHLLQCHTMGIAAATSYFDYKYSIDGMLDYSSCGNGNAILVAVIDPVTLVPWKSGRDTAAHYGHINDPKCPSRTREDLYFVFPADSAHFVLLDNFLTNVVPDGHYILIYNFLNGMFKTFPEELYQTFEALGGTSIRSLENNYPYILFCEKGNISSAVEKVGTSSSSDLNLNEEIENLANYGYMTSTLIGPSTNWGSLHWRFRTDTHFDIAKLQVTGITSNGARQVIFPELSNDSLDIYNLEQFINADTHPYMEMTMFNTDDSLKTPVWTERWQVTYDGIPETAINPSKGTVFFNDTLVEGDTLIFGVATENISGFDMDSLLVRYWVTDRNNNVVPLETKRLRTHPSQDVLIDTIHFCTRNYPGINSIWYEVNTVNSANGLYDQPEQYHFNNYAQKSFFVSSDIINPLLDVTFDGIRILNGDIVSSKPFITISLKDENKFIALNDTGVYQVYIKNLQTGTEERVYFSDVTLMKFIPAVLPKNSCKIEYTPYFPVDGKYQLRVQAKDMSQNESGDNDYTIQFEVINKSTITSIFNYPNPFSTSTRFVFTLTGSEIPEEIRIQIITVTGKVVREITQSELGPIHIGNNVTEFAWDGTDMYGDKLANGVYFYRVITKLSGSSIEHRETEADQFFNKGFGKMYLMR